MIDVDDMLQRTKIVATLGPASTDECVLSDMILAGVNVVRINCSHGTHEQYAKWVRSVRHLSEKHHLIVAVLADLQGPKIRIARFKTGSIMLREGELFTLDPDMDDDSGHEHAVGVDYKELASDVETGDILLLNDGLIRLRVLSVEENHIHTEVLIGGELSNNKGINRLGGGLTAPALTDKDREDLAFMLKQGVDYVAVSFPRDANDMTTARDLLGKDHQHVGLIAKIERKEAMDHLDDIIKASDGIMVARGDLGVEIGEAQVPLAQRHMISRARKLDKPVIIATQMMESMVHQCVPTRAEVSDVATAVLDNADAVMLSAETATGQYPVEAVRAMANTAKAVEKNPESHQSSHRVNSQFGRTDEAIAMATMYAANHLSLEGIVTLSETGKTPLWMSRIRTAIPIYALSRHRLTLAKMALYRGVYPVYFDPTKVERNAVNREAIDCVVKAGYLKEGDCVILTKGDHMGIGGGSNALKILTVGQVE